MLAWISRPVVITGAAGWLGSRLVETLLSGGTGHDELPPLPSDVPLRCLALPGTAGPLRALAGARAEIVTGDLRDPAACRALCEGAAGGILFHVAGLIHPRRVRELYEVNVAGTESLLAAAARAGLKRAVVVSSSSPMGNNPSPDHLFDEQSPYRPYLGYGRSKMLMEQAVAACGRRGELETVIIRAPWFYGPRQPARQTLFFELIRRGRLPLVGDGENRRSMAYVDNLCQGLQLAALRAEAAGRLFWIADERPYTMNEIVDTVEQVLEELGFSCAHRRLRLPNLAGRIAWLADSTLQSLGLYHQKIHVLSELNQHIACSVREAQRALGYRPAVALAEGMRRSVQYCIDQGLLTPDRSARREG